MLARTYSFLEPLVANGRPSRLVLVRRFLVALERALRTTSEREGACRVAGNVFGLPTLMLSAAATSGPDEVDAFLERALAERLESAPEELGNHADWLVRWGPLVESLVPDGPHGASPVPDMVTLAPDLAALFARLPELARSPLCLMLEGQPGTGRESFARVVHAAQRPLRPFVAWDCRQSHPSDAEQQLFGHALAPGILSRAHGGTLLIRNAEWLPSHVQQRLARCLEFGRLVDEAADRNERLDVRFIFCVSDGALERAGTHQPGTLEPDFAFRASVLHARLPPLAKREEDLAALYRNIVRRFVLGREAPLSPVELEEEPRMALSPRALLALHAYDWPGNVTEFVAVVREARQRAAQSPVELSHLPERVVRALSRPGNAPEDHLRRLLVEVAPTAALATNEHTQARRRLREWRDGALGRVLGPDTLDLITRAVATFNALREGAVDELIPGAAIAHVRASAAREVLLPAGSAVPLFDTEREELVGELEALAATHPLGGALARRFSDLGRALVLYPVQAREQLAPRLVDHEQRPSPVTLALLAASR